MSNENVSNFIIKTDSIWKIIDKALYEVKFHDEVKKCSITKCIKPLNIIFRLTVNKIFNNNIIKCQLISSTNEKFSLTSTPILGIFCNRQEIDFETQTDIIVEVASDLSMENESERMRIADENATTIKYLFNRFCFTSKLTIYNLNYPEITDDFVLLILENLETKQLEYLSPISLYSILVFISKYDINKHNIFHGIPNLKEFTIHVGYSNIFKDKLMLDYKLWRFIDNVVGEKIQLRISFDPDDISIFLAVTIYRYCKEKNINILISVRNDEVKFFDRIKNGISRNDYKFIENLSSITLKINNFSDLEHIKYILTKMGNLENFKITFDRQIYPRRLKNVITMKDVLRLYNHYFNFKTKIKKLKSFILEYCSESYPTFFETYTILEKMYDIFINSILSSLTSSLKIIKFLKLPYLKEEYFNSLYICSPNLVTISFNHCHHIPDDALLLFKNLRHVVITNTIGITIPSWVEIVMYKEFSSLLFKNYLLPQVKKRKWKFYRLMKNYTFKNTFWIDDNYTPDSVIFIKDILNWKEAIDLLNI
uniref:F-box domain-containing protein n=1 Tax=Strongyloides venezuelensis TaxID=75913 RepID=A0A0K0FPQ0_STRVS